jgi:SAM-dependent methyltransferase
LSFVKSTVRRMLPEKWISTYSDYRQMMLTRRNRQMSTEEVFTDIYSKNRWGGKSGTFNSGDGSHETAVVSPYVAALAAELERLGAGSMTVVDLGCGDFSVGQLLAPYCGRYVGVDIVKPLVIHNQATYGNDHVSFQHLNIVADELPSGDICFVRQVLQHLSNQQIAAALPKLRQFRWSFITEHHPSPERFLFANADKAHGDSIRIKGGSGVFLDQPPFCVPADSFRLLLEVRGILALGDSDPGVIRTYLMKGRP